MVVRTMRWETIVGFLGKDIFKVLAPVRDDDFLGGCVVDTFLRLGEALTKRLSIPRGVSLGESFG
jgi:hypothetical protein